MYSSECLLSRRAFRNDSLAAGSPYMVVSEFLLCWTIVYFVVTLIWLHYAQSRFRLTVTNASWPHILLLDMSCMAYLVVGPVRDLVGYESFLCDVELWFRIIGVVLSLVGFALELLFFRNKVVLSRLLNQANFAQLQELVRENNNNKQQPYAVGSGGLSMLGGKHRSSSKEVDKPAASAAAAAAASTLSSVPNHLNAQLRADIHDAFWYKSKTYNLLVAGGLSLLPILVCGLAIQLTQPHYGKGCVNCLVHAWHYGLFLGMGAICAAFIIVGMFRLRREKDALHILRALYRDAAILVSCMVVTVVLYQADTEFGDLISRAVFSPDWVMIVGFNVVHTLLVPWRILGAYRKWYKAHHQHLLQHNQMGGESGLQTLLQDVEGLDLFTQHLVHEFSAENLRFYTHAKTYRENYDLLAMRAQTKVVAEEIFATFIEPGSLLEVNISGTIKKRIADQLAKKHYPLVLFLEAEQEILRVLETDSFSRFIKTKEYAAWAQTGVLSMLEGSHHHRLGV